MFWWSFALGVVGVLSSALWLALWRGTAPGREREWLGGLLALFPGWLVGILGLLGTGTLDSAEFYPPRALVLSSAAALLGVIASDYVRRRLKPAATTRPALWLLGLAGFSVGWVLALWHLSSE